MPRTETEPAQWGRAHKAAFAAAAMGTGVLPEA